MIPKIIHYCWLEGEIPAAYKRCMKTWGKLTGWEFMRWDSAHFDINSVLWVKQACEVELYTFAVDYIRHYALYTHGGIFLDTDIEIIKPFDELLHKSLLLGAINNETLETGFFGARKRHPYIKKCMGYYENQSFFDPEHFPEIMKRDRSRRVGIIQPILAPVLMGSVFSESFTNAGYDIYSNEYFTVRNPVTGEAAITKNIFAV
jgi:hypothetical protein